MIEQERAWSSGGPAGGKGTVCVGGVESSRKSIQIDKRPGRTIEMGMDTWAPPSPYHTYSPHRPPNTEGATPGYRYTHAPMGQGTATVNPGPRHSNREPLHIQKIHRLGVNSSNTHIAHGGQEAWTADMCVDTENCRSSCSEPSPTYTHTNAWSLCLFMGIHT